MDLTHLGLEACILFIIYHKLIDSISVCKVKWYNRSEYCISIMPLCFTDFPLITSLSLFKCFTAEVMYFLISVNSIQYYFPNVFNFTSLWLKYEGLYVRVT